MLQNVIKKSNKGILMKYQINILFF